MKAIILEDETRAANHLERMLAKVAPNVVVISQDRISARWSEIPAK